MRLPLFVALLLLLAPALLAQQQQGPDCRDRETCLRQHSQAGQQPGLGTPPPLAHVQLNLSHPLKPISKDLFGIFFEEVCQCMRLWVRPIGYS